MATCTMLVQMARDLDETASARLLQQHLDQKIAAAEKVEMLAKQVGKDAKTANRAAAR